MYRVLEGADIGVCGFTWCGGNKRNRENQRSSQGNTCLNSYSNTGRIDIKRRFLPLRYPGYQLVYDIGVTTKRKFFLFI